MTCVLSVCTQVLPRPNVKSLNPKHVWRKSLGMLVVWEEYVAK